jgi:hypothetical protein
VAYTAHKVLYLEYLISATEGIGLSRIKQLHVGRQSYEGSDPKKWFESGANIGIEPLPDGTYNLRAYVSDYPSSEMTTNSDLPALPPEYRPLIVLYGFERALKKEGRFGHASQIKSIYYNELFHTRVDKNELIPDSFEDIEDGKW